MNTILIFKTSVQSKSEVLMLKSYIENIVKDSKWNFDLDDSDRIFRVETEMNMYYPLVSLFNEKGFLCEELED